jgi:hypothetical protein
MDSARSADTVLAMVVVGYSAHGNRALENARAELRRTGLRV